MKFICLIALSMISLASRAQSPSQDTTIYQQVDTAAQFPKGDAGWQKFLNKHFTYSSSAMQKEIQGVVVVQYVVETDGSVTNIMAISGPRELRNDAENSIKNSPKWIPAIKDGIKVRSYKKQPIVFRLNH